MKKIRIAVIFILFMMCPFLLFAQQKTKGVMGKGAFYARFYDLDKNPTNIRNAPNGIDNNEIFEGIKPVKLKGDCWVHSSVIKSGLIGGKLYAKPNSNSQVIESIEYTVWVIRFLNMKDDWVQIVFSDEENKKHKGWVPVEYTCPSGCQ